MTKKDLYFCLRCSMVKIGSGNAVGRVTIVNYENESILDEYVKIPVPVSNYYSEKTGITEELMNSNGLTFEKVREQVSKIIAGKILIGHGLEMDLSSLGLTHPWTDIRDTANYAPFMKEVADQLSVMLLPRELDSLSQQFLQRDGPREPVSEAVTILDLYKLKRTEWESELIKLVQQKERQRQCVFGQRSPEALSAIQEGQVAFCEGKRGRSASMEPIGVDLSTIGSLTERTSPHSTFIGDDDVSETSTFFTTDDRCGPNAMPSGSEIENLREVLHQESVEVARQRARYEHSWHQDQPSISVSSGHWSAGTPTTPSAASLWSSTSPSPFARGNTPTATWNQGAAFQYDAPPQSNEFDESTMLEHLPSQLLADLNVDEEHSRRSWFRRLSGSRRSNSNGSSAVGFFHG